MTLSPLASPTLYLLWIIAGALMLVTTGCDGQELGQEPEQEEETDDPSAQIMLLRPLPDVTFQSWRDTTIILQDHFAHSENGTLSFTVQVDSSPETADAVSARVIGPRFIITPYDAGLSEVVVTASDSDGAQRSDTLNAKVLVTPHPLAGNYTLVSALDYYGEWALPSLQSFTSGCITFWVTGGTLGIDRSGDVVQVTLSQGSCSGPPSLNTGTPRRLEGQFTSDTSGWFEVERDTFAVQALGDTLELNPFEYNDLYRYVRSQ